MQRAAARSSVDTSSTLGRTASGRSGKRSQFLALRFCAVLVLAAGATLLALQSVARSAAAKLPAPPEAQAGCGPGDRGGGGAAPQRHR